MWCGEREGGTLGYETQDQQDFMLLCSICHETTTTCFPKCLKVDTQRLTHKNPNSNLKF